jgi:hypothetical protein
LAERHVTSKPKTKEKDIEKNPNTFRGVNDGWPAVFSSLKSLLETGEAIAFSPSG